MGKARLTDEPIVAMQRGSNRDGVAVVTKRHGVSEQAIYGWRNKFGAFQANDVRRLKQLENENAQLRKLMAERGLEIEVIKEIKAKIVSVPIRRPQVAHATRRGIFQGRACTLMTVNRSDLGYCTRRTARYELVIARMREIAGQYPRSGYRRIRISLCRERWPLELRLVQRSRASHNSRKACDART